MRGGGDPPQKGEEMIGEYGTDIVLKEFGIEKAVTVIDARDSHKVPERKHLSIDAVMHDEEWKTGAWTLFCIKLDGKYVACAQKDDEPVLMCAEYKTKRGFENWMKRNGGE